MIQEALDVADFVFSSSSKGSLLFANLSSVLGGW